MVPSEVDRAVTTHDVYEHNGHHVHQSDCWVIGEDGTALAAKRHTGIFLVAAR